MILPITPMQEKEDCELCGSKNADVDFIHVNLNPDNSVEAKICSSCWHAFGDDSEIALLILEKRGSNGR